MAEANITHDIEARLRNLEAHAGIGHVDEETGEYTVDQHEDVAPAPVEEEAPKEDEDALR